MTALGRVSSFGCLAPDQTSRSIHPVRTYAVEACANCANSLLQSVSLRRISAHSCVLVTAWLRQFALQLVCPPLRHRARPCAQAALGPRCAITTRPPAKGGPVLIFHPYGSGLAVSGRCPDFSDPRHRFVLSDSLRAPHSLCGWRGCQHPVHWSIDGSPHTPLFASRGHPRAARTDSTRCGI